MTRYYADPDGGMTTLDGLKNDLVTTPYLHGKPLEYLLQDCVYLGTDRAEAERKLHDMHEWTPSGECLSY